MVEMIRLWTLQTAAAWEMLQQDGVLRCRQEQTEAAFRHAYGWMREQMQERIGPPPESGLYPLWAWYHWHGEQQPRPDMRYRGQLAPGERAMRIEFRAPRTEALLSDFSLWHHVLNGWYLGASLGDDEAFEAERARSGLHYPLGLPGDERPLSRLVRASWQRIFAIDWTDPDHFISQPPAVKSVQATLWELRLEQVEKAELFCGR